MITALIPLAYFALLSQVALSDESPTKRIASHGSNHHQNGQRTGVRKGEKTHWRILQPHPAILETDDQRHRDAGLYHFDLA